MNYNKVMIAGNLTRDPELRQTQNGTSVANFTVAINESHKDASGNIVSVPNFVDVQAFGRTAENINKYFFKGSPIFIDGRLHLNTWEDKQTGQKRSKVIVIVDKFEFIGGKESGNGANGTFGKRAESPAQGNTQRDFIDERKASQTLDEDEPF